MKWGQNFLINPKVAERIIKEAEINSSDVVVEVGPGKGALTYLLTKQAKKVIAIEKDESLILKEKPNLEIVYNDILDFKKLPSKYKVVANLPYYITSPIIRYFLENKKKPSEMIIMVQKEVAQRICSPGNLLYLSVHFYAEAKILFNVAKGNFKPTPKVDSSVIKIYNIKKQPEDKKFFQLIKKGFSQKRKQLGNLLDADWLKQNNIDPRRRAETLSLNEWKDLTKKLGSVIIKKHE
jgi:16S rRNA (adenine1518-N6/adenine1519-N6)-dimethyltransferase